MLYNIGFLIFSIIYLPILIFKGKLHGEFHERFGRYAPVKERGLLSGRGRIWIQAVSVGEVAVCRSLIPLLKEAFPERDLVISTITKAGNDLAKKLFSKDAAIIYFPLDFSFTVRRALKYIKPDIYIMIETEIWPNLLKELSLNSIPSIMVNGRISDRSIGKYRLVRHFLKNTLSGISAFCMQDAIDAERIVSLGAPVDRVKVTGNMKFDVEASANIIGQDVIRRSLGIDKDDLLLVAGSTHGGEEEALVVAFKELGLEFPRLKLLIAPRHVDRVNEIEDVINRYGFTWRRVSKLSDLSDRSYSDIRILILDTIGHLNEAYSVASMVFVGGSLIEHGGQNPVEPAVLGRAILFGPHMFNFRYITETLLKRDAAVQVNGPEELAGKIKVLIRDPVRRKSLGDNAKKVIADNRGATKKNLEEIRKILG